MKVSILFDSHKVVAFLLQFALYRGMFVTALMIRKFGKAPKPHRQLLQFLSTDRATIRDLKGGMVSTFISIVG